MVWLYCRYVDAEVVDYGKSHHGKRGRKTGVDIGSEAGLNNRQKHDKEAEIEAPDRPM